jgi:hypothetical protein
MTRHGVAEFLLRIYSAVAVDYAVLYIQYIAWPRTLLTELRDRRVLFVAQFIACTGLFADPH